MEFPLYLRWGGLEVHPHVFFESLAYLVGFQVYAWRRRRLGDAVPAGHRWWLVAAATVGAAAGSKLLYWLSDPLAVWDGRDDLGVVWGGKTIVGGLLGGWIAVELAKRRLGIRRATGDLFAAPLALGIAIGRVGCFLTGLADKTHGLATSLPWGVDFGDGVARHPTQLYEIAFLALLLPLLVRLDRRPHREGDTFKLFLAAYLGFRLLVEFLKPGVPLFGLTAIQWACLAALAYYLPHLPRLAGRPQELPHA